MNITNTRAQSTRCWRKTLNLYHRNIEGPKSVALVDGGAVHSAIAYGLATRDWATAIIQARPKFQEDIEMGDLDPSKIEDHWNMVEAITHLFRNNFEREEYEVIQPECMIDVPIPQSHHNCIWLHHLEWNQETKAWDEKWGCPSPEAILERRVLSPHPGSFEIHAITKSRIESNHRGHKSSESCPCWVPHRILGQTDALLLWEKNIWLHEVKTTAITGDQFWLQWELDLQPTIYMYGVWKQLGIQPRGMIYSALRKPTEKQVSGWNSKRKDGLEIPAYQRLDYERRAIPYTTEDILRVEWVLRDLCDEWEQRIVRGDFRPALMRGICNEYNRPCDFHIACHCHEEEGSFAGTVARHDRYDDEVIAKQLIQIKEKVHVAR